MRNQKVSGKVWWATLMDVDNAVREAVPWDVDDAVDDTMNDAVWWSDAVDDAVDEVVWDLVEKDFPSFVLQDFLQKVRESLMPGKNIIVNDALWREVWEVVENAVNGGADGGVWWAVGKSLSQVETAAEASTWTLPSEPEHPELPNFLRLCAKPPAGK